MKIARFGRAATMAIALGVAGSSAAAGQATHPEGHAHGNDATGVPLYDDLGTHHFGITTSDPLAQRYFDQGLRLYYAFNHAEGIRAFEEARRLDPSCAMCAWGIALSLGPNINAAMEEEAVEPAFAAIGSALALAFRATPLERDLIAALATRYVGTAVENRAPLDSAYTHAMGEVARKHRNSIEAAVLYAESRLDLRPWDYWTKAGTPSRESKMRSNTSRGRWMRIRIIQGRAISLSTPWKRWRPNALCHVPSGWRA